jgi:hypothetical protein
MRRASAALFILIFCTFANEGRTEPALAHFGAPLGVGGSTTLGSSPWVAWPGRTLAAIDAEDESAAEDADGTEAAAEESEEALEETDEAAEASPTADTEATETPWLEKENTDYHFIGVRARMVYIPTFMFSLFQADGGKAVLAPSIGPEYVTRRNGFEVDAWLTYASYGMGDAPFKSKSDPDVAYEIVRSELKTISVGADFLWTKPLNEKGLSLVYGGGAGIGVVFGSLYRNQAYPPDGQPGDPETYVKCPAQGTQGYCDNDNDHYGDYTEPSWFDGGAKPVLFPWIAIPQVGLRWKPSKQFVLRFDTGLSLPGPFFFGVSGQYGLL